MNHPLRGPILFATFVLLGIVILSGSQVMNVYYNIQINESQKKLDDAQKKLSDAMHAYEQSKSDAIDNTVELKQAMIDLASDLKKKGIVINAKLVADLQNIGFEKEAK